MVRQACLLAAVAIVSLLSLELLLRLVATGDDAFRERQRKWEFERGVKRHPRWGWGFAANVEFPSDDIRIRTVSIPGAPEHGMRDRGVDPSRPIVAAVLGDSFTFGADVDIDDIWCHRIESRHPQLEMLNLAVGGGAAKAAEQYAVPARRPAAPRPRHLRDVARQRVRRQRGIAEPTGTGRRRALEAPPPGLNPRLDLEQPNRIVLAMCTRLGIDCIDTLEVCRQHADEPLFWQLGVHFNPRGHAVVADETERQMAARGLLADR
jgi:hypothetical protein